MVLMRFVTDFHQQLHSRHLQGHGRAQTVVGGAEDIAALLGDDLPVLRPGSWERRCTAPRILNDPVR